ncbi:glucosamine inositolphosphorylceramide transferase family protein [Aureimonas ureilytica]|uniref:glucosamine inositolphosphorylceramide transferase family protein n=1 Tax=Aureimonas ureilytica TaxID=401562 RepID=UPI003CF25F8D
MRIVLHVNESDLRQWHRVLVERLAANPACRVELAIGNAPSRLPAGTEALFRLESAVHGLQPRRLSAPLERGQRPAPPDSASTPPDLAIDLTGEAAASGARVWTLAFNGAAGEAGLLAAILAGQPIRAEILEDGRVLAEGRLGTEYPGVALATFEDVLARTITLIGACVETGGPGALPALPGEAPMADAGSGRPLAERALRTAAGAVLRRVYRLCYRTPHWRTGWRRCEGGDLFDLKAHPASGWTDLPDDGKRFYADPFPIETGGAVTLFVEDYVHALGKGLISAVRFGPDGPLGAPVPVLEQDCHLSYPFVFEREGEVWMIPETNQRGTIELFRASTFPGGWVREAVLVSGLSASDATLVEKDGLFWLFATVRDGGGAFSDALHLWSAPDFRGPWTPHPRNPVLIDIASARPAGRMVWREGTLWRPVQDCRRGYGAAMGLARVLRLDADGFEQVVETILTPGPRWPGRRLHSLNRAGPYEFIDGSGTAPRWS